MSSRMTLRRGRLAFVVVLLLTAGCAQAPSSARPAADGSAVARASGPSNAGDHSAPPPLLDVPEYRGDSARTGANPGPGPIEQPELVWSRDAGDLEFTPVLADGVLMIGAGDGHFYGLDARTGDQRWVYPASGSLEAITGFASTGGGVAVFSTAGGLHALDVRSGTLDWEAPGKGGIITDIVGGVVYSAANDGHAYGLDRQTGDEAWAWQAPGPATYITVDGGVAYVSVDDGQVYAVSIESGEVLWHVPTISQAGASVVAGDVVFASARGDAGEIYAIDRSSGNVLWTYRPVSGLGMSLGAVDRGVLYAGGSGDGLFAFAVKPDDPRHVTPLWQVDQAGSIIKGQARVGDILYVPVADPASVIAVDVNGGTILWRLPLDGPAQGPVVSGGMLFATDQSGVIRAFAEPWLKALIDDPASGPLAAGGAAEPALPDPFEIVDTFDWATTGLKTPWSMDIAPNGLLYALDAKPSVSVIDPATGRQVNSWGVAGSGEGEFDLRGSNGNPGAGGLDVGPHGLVYVADAGNLRVQVFEPDGTFVRQVGSFGTAPGQFSSPAQVLATDDGSMFVVDSGTLLITKFGPDKRVAWQASAPFEGDDQRRSPLHSVSLLADGRVVVFMDGGGPAAVLDPDDGTFVGLWGAGLRDARFGGSGEARVDATGHVYCFVYVPYAQVVLAPDGTVLAAESGEAGQLFFPPPVIGPDGYGYSFGPDGLVKLKVSLPAD
jgi:outer membrane protein assembly factor BamB